MMGSSRWALHRYLTVAASIVDDDDEDMNESLLDDELYRDLVTDVISDEIAPINIRGENEEQNAENNRKDNIAAEATTYDTCVRCWKDANENCMNVEVCSKG